MVHFVGAGPGAEDLITVRGMEYLKKADIVIYAGSLVNPALLQYCRKECEIHDSAYMTLEEVLQVVQAGHAQGKDIVRLHTGDSSIYGAIREQMDELEKLGIDYDVVPGVSSFQGAAAALNLEYTLPGISQTVILTRMEGRTPVPEKEDIALLASHQASMVLFLSVGMLDKLQEKLLAGGYKESTPAAIVYKATWPEQKIVMGHVGELPQMAKEHDIKKTALVLVGDVVGCRDYLRSKLYDPTFSTDFRKASAEEV